MGRGWVPVEEIDRDTVRRDDVRRPAHERVTAVGRENYGRCHRRLEERVEVGEALDVEHVDFVDEEDLIQPIPPQQNRSVSQLWNELQL